MICTHKGCKYRAAEEGSYPDLCLDCLVDVLRDEAADRAYNELKERAWED